MRTLGGVLALSLAAGCSEDGATRAAGAAGAEAASIGICRSVVEQRSGEAFDEAQPPWRITSRDEADGHVVNIWTETRRDAQRPSDVPNYVCVTKRDREAEDGVRLVEVRP